MKHIPVFRIVGLVLVIFMLTHMASPAIANESYSPNQRDEGRNPGGGGGHGESDRRYEEHGKKERCQQKTPDSFTEVPNLAFDHSLVESTPHWIFLAAGEKEKSALLKYVDQAAVSPEKRNEWEQFLKRIWEKYPVRYEKTESSPRIVLDDSHRRYSLTPRENETFREIELYIAQDMDTTQGNQIVVQWAGDTHYSLIRDALLKELNIDNYHLEQSASAAQAPDDWYINDAIPFEQQYNHGFVPLGITVDAFPATFTPREIFGIGTAPDNFGQYAQLAKTAYTSRNYDDAFENMGYASHFISDLGNPYHTPNVQVIPLQFVDLPFSLIVFPNAQIVVNYKLLHDEYESYVFEHLADFGDIDERNDISDPLYSARIHGAVSWIFSYPLMYQCYWHYVFFRNLDYSSNPAIVEITKNRIIETAKLNRGLVRYVTAGMPITYTITPSAAVGGSISPSSPVTISLGQSQTFSITPDSGYLIKDVQVNGQSVGSVSQFTFDMDTINKGTGDQTIAVNFMPASSSDWIWARDGWGDWEHTASWSGRETGPNSEYGPIMVGEHGTHGIQTSLNGGTTAASVWRTFYDPTGRGWNSLTFEGALSRSDTASGRWMNIEVNGIQVFGATEMVTPPGNWGEPFAIQASFPQTDTATVKISHGQIGAYGPLFLMDYTSIKIDTQSDVTLAPVQLLPPVIVTGEDFGMNATEI